jgi:hypothetical protein
VVRKGDFTEIISHFIILLLLLLVAGCSETDSELSVATRSPILTESPILQEFAATPERTRIIPTPTFEPTAPEKIVKFQPFEIASGAALAAKPVDALVLCGDSTIQLLRFVPEVKVEMIPGIPVDILCYPTSPDGKWIAYEQDYDESVTGQWLIVQSADGQQQKKIPLDPDWISFGDYV